MSCKGMNVQGTIADEESRDWMLDKRVFQTIQTRTGPLSIDLFASRLTTQLQNFFSWRPAIACTSIERTKKSDRLVFNTSLSSIHCIVYSLYCMASGLGNLSNTRNLIPRNTFSFNFQSFPSYSTENSLQ